MTTPVEAPREYETLKFQVADGIARVALNRPDRRNALNPRMMGELIDVFTFVDTLPDVRAVVLSGEGDMFCGGADIGWLKSTQGQTRDEIIDDSLIVADMLGAIWASRAPVVARVHNVAFGGALGLIGAADYTIASKGTEFSFREVLLGIAPNMISPFVVPRIGPANAQDLILTGRTIDADEAREMGLVNEVVPNELLLDTAVDGYIEDLLKGSPNAQAAIKGKLFPLLYGDPRRFRRETAELTADLRLSPEGQDGLRAFFEKREPSWRQAN